MDSPAQTDTTTAPETNEALLTRLEQLSASNANLTNQSAALISERDGHQIRAYALEKIIAAHHIDISQALTPAALSTLKVTDGAVNGEFAYTAPGLTTQQPTQEPAKVPNSQSTTPTMTRESIEKMTDDEINDNWDQISAFLSKSGATA